MNVIEKAIALSTIEEIRSEGLEVTYRACYSFPTQKQLEEILGARLATRYSEIERDQKMRLIRLASHTPKANWKPTNRSPKKLARLRHSLTQSTIQKYATFHSHH